jgi:hypothetical protein
MTERFKIQIGAPGGWTVGPDMTAFVEAADTREAGQRVRQAVGRDPDVLSDAEPQEEF